MPVILGTSKETLTETISFMLDHSRNHKVHATPVQTRQKVEQVKAYFIDGENPHNPLHEAVKDTKGCRLGRGKSWLGQAEGSIRQVCQLREFKQTKEWERYPNRFQHLYEILLSENLDKHCRERPAGKTESEIKLFIQETAKCKTS